MKTVKKTLLCLLAVGLMAMTAEVTLAQQATGCGAQPACGCTKCGDCKICPKGCGKFQCDCQCDKVCKPTMTTKKVTRACWVCECKMICLVGPSCGCQGTCGRSRVVKRLIRKTITKEVPIVKCNVVDATGCGCASGGCDSAPPAAAPDASAQQFHFDGGFSLRLPSAGSLFRSGG